MEWISSCRSAWRISKISGNTAIISWIKTLFIKELLDMKGKGQSLYPAPEIRQNTEYEHSPIFL